MVYTIGGLLILGALIGYFKIKNFINGQDRRISELESELVKVKLNKTNEMIDVLNDVKAIQVKAPVWSNHDTEISKLIEEKLSACMRSKFKLLIKNELNTAINDNV